VAQFLVEPRNPLVEPALLFLQLAPARLEWIRLVAGPHENESVAGYDISGRAT
jgi:hypothetical protein